jgi:hypothetical protein
MGGRKLLVVTGPAVVLGLEAGGERYLYRDALIGDGFTEESVKRAIANGLVSEVEVVEVEEPEEKSLDDFTKAELEAEIEKRNEGREDDVKVVPAGSNKPDLLAALKADDERLAAQK